MRKSYCVYRLGCFFGVSFVAPEKSPKFFGDYIFSVMAENLAKLRCNCVFVNMSASA